MFNLFEITSYLICKRNITQIDSKEYVDWAVKLLENGYDSDNLIILAGLDYSDTEERLKYFNKSLEDLKIQNPNVNNEVLSDFAHQLANNVIEGIETPEKGFKIMYDLVIASDYSSKYLQFMDLDEEIESLKYSEHPIYNIVLNNDNKNELIVNEFRLFLQNEPVYMDFRELAYCQHCKQSMKPYLKKHWSIFKAKSYYYYTCLLCGSKDLVHGTSQKGRELILQIKN